jgi:hypothetical protein
MINKIIYAQFFQLSATDKTQIIEAIGDRSVIILDARSNHLTHNLVAYRECAKRGYVGFQIFKGESFTRSVAISTLYTLTGTEREYLPAYIYAVRNGYTGNIGEYVDLQYACYCKICSNNSIEPETRGAWEESKSLPTLPNT